MFPSMDSGCSASLYSFSPIQQAVLVSKFEGVFYYRHPHEIAHGCRGTPGRFDAHTVLMTGELNELLLNDLVFTLDGEPA
jgi:hypothetical protein